MVRQTTGRRRATRTDGEATRARILAVAGARFADKGFADTTSKEIAAEAGVDLASINYHFRDRAGLYQAVLAEAHRRIADLHDIEAIVASDRAAPEKLREIIRFLLGDGTERPQWAFIVLGREILSPSVHLQRLQSDEVLPKLRALLPVISEITGLPPEHPALLRCLPCIGAPCAAFILLRQTGKPLTMGLLGSSAEDDVDHLHRYVMGGLLAVGARSLE